MHKYQLIALCTISSINNTNHAVSLMRHMRDVISIYEARMHSEGMWWEGGGVDASSRLGAFLLDAVQCLYVRL